MRRRKLSHAQLQGNGKIKSKSNFNINLSILYECVFCVILLLSCTKKITISVPPAKPINFRFCVVLVSWENWKKIPSIGGCSLNNTICVLSLLYVGRIKVSFFALVFCVKCHNIFMVSLCYLQTFLLMCLLENPHFA